MRAESVPSDQVQHILAVEAVASTREPTVGAVARALGLDQSGASRMVRDAVGAGFLLRAPSLGDRRRVELMLTDEGDRLLDASRDWQRDTFDQLTRHWSALDRARFAGYLQRLADELAV